MIKRQHLFSAFHWLDMILASAYLGVFKEKNSLLIFLFHSMVSRKSDINPDIIEPQRIVSRDEFRQFIEYYLVHDYRFVSPQEMIDGLDEKGKHILVTFDDGYYNNHLALPLMQEYKIPAVFFISVNHVVQNKCFWWDVQFREGRKTGKTLKEIAAVQSRLKGKKNHEIEKYLIDTYGEKALSPLGDLDRPFTPSELKDFSYQEYVHIGNHSTDHAILTNYSEDEMRSQIWAAQEALKNMTGMRPVIISYPDGAYSKQVMRISEESGLVLGVSTQYGKNKLPIDFAHHINMKLKRVGFSDSASIPNQCKIFRSDISLKYAARFVIRKFLKKVVY
jgi:peptidoglycan/xylan/chitin deacetylase (PgdA/CDA1 family)